jgi:hypothetical protein
MTGSSRLRSAPTQTTVKRTTQRFRDDGSRARYIAVGLVSTTTRGGSTEGGVYFGPCSLSRTRTDINANAKRAGGPYARTLRIWPWLPTHAFHDSGDLSESYS